MAEEEKKNTFAARPSERKRGFAAGGDEAAIADYTTAQPVAGTIVRRDEHNFIRANGVQIVRGFLEVGRTVRLIFPTTAPPANTFLAHNADGVLEWLPPAAISGTIDWSQIVFTPVTLSGYGITDAYTQSQIQNLFDNITFADTGFGNPIGGLILTTQVPAAAVTQHEAALSLSFTQMFDQILDSQVPASAVLQHLDLDEYVTHPFATLGELLGYLLSKVSTEPQAAELRYAVKHFT